MGDIPSKGLPSEKHAHKNCALNGFTV